MKKTVKKEAAESAYKADYFRRAALKDKGYFGREKEMLLAWAKDCGVVTDNVEDTLLTLLRLSGSKSDNLRDAWIDIYTLSGLEGTEAEMELSFWRDLKGRLPLAPMAGWTGKEYCAK